MEAPIEEPQDTRVAQIGALVGAISLPIAVYLSSSPCHPDDPCFTPFFMGLGVGVGAVLGAGTGAIIGAATWKPPNTTPK